VPDATLVVIGDGPYAGELKRLTARLGLENVVDFTGFNDDPVDIENRVAEAALAIAPYVPDPLSFTRFADPTKIKTYLACGVPVLMTDVPNNADQVHAAGAGTVVAYDLAAFADAALGYLSDPAALQVAREAASRLGSEFVWSRIFDAAFESTAALVGSGQGGSVPMQPG
jgi:glycosyltransferase involved in cell wall biosynthesis